MGQPDAAKTRKSPEPRGLTVTLPLETSQALQELAVIGGITTKQALEVELAAFVLDKGLGLFRQHLANKGQQRINAVLGGAAPPTDPEPLPAHGANLG